MHHEIGLAQDILIKALKLADERGIRSIAGIDVAIGEFYLPNASQIEHSFRHVSAGTAAEGARLTIKVVPILARCSSCGRDIGGISLKCASCGGTGADIIKGKELLVEISRE